MVDAKEIQFMYDSQAPAAAEGDLYISDFSAMESATGVLCAPLPPSVSELVMEEAFTANDVEDSALEAEPAPIEPDASTLPTSMQGVIGSSESLLEVYRVIDRVADTTCTILITGESGTGKELVARAVHRASQRDG